jgi:PKD repeat protein
MKKYVLLLLLAFVFSVFNQVSAQISERFKGSSIQKAKVTFSQIEAYDKQQPIPEKKMKTPNKKLIYPEFPIDGKKILFEEKPSSGSINMNAPKDPSPLPDANFLGLDDSGNSIPPDVNGAAGPNHLMVTLNTQTRIMDKEGNVLSTVSTGSFWFPLVGSGDTFDPKVMYDPYKERWIMVMPSSSDVLSSKLFVGVSENTDPTGVWYLYSFDTDPNNNHWFDYPSYGFNKNWVVVSGNMFGAGFGYNVLFVIDKSDLYNNAAEVGYSRFEMDDAFTVVPAITYDPDLNEMYMISSATGNSGGSGYLNLWRVSGVPGIEVVEDLGLVGTPNPWSTWAPNSGNLAPQLGIDERINSGDARIQNAIYRNGKIWCAHHIFLPAGDPTHSAIQWWEMDTEGTLLQRGRVHDESGFYHFTFPTIAVNANEDIMIGYGSFSEEQYASSSYSFRYADDPANTLRDRYQYKDGLAPYFKTFGGARNRWGDYTNTCVDPIDDLDFWTLQEYADLPSGDDKWATWWAKIKIDAIPEADFTSNITSVPTGSEVDFEDQSKFEPTEWLWTFEGGTPATSTEQNPQNIVYETSGLFDVTLVATNYLGSNTLTLSDFINSNTEILPEVYFAVSDTLPCTSEVVVFSDESIYNPVTWNWEFIPEGANFVNGTSASSKNPEVKFETAGFYQVNFTATNLNGSNTLSKQEYIKSGGLPIPFIEDFESKSFASQSWTIENPDNEKTWEITSVGGSEPGDQASYMNLRNYSGLGERDNLITPMINLSPFENAYLEFQYAYARRFEQNNDSLNVYVSNDCGQSWTKVMAKGEDGSGSFETRPMLSGNFVPETEEEWCKNNDSITCAFINISDYAGSPDIQIKFESYNGFGNNLFVDNVSIKSTFDVSEGELNPGTISIYPNPTEDLLYINLNSIKGSTQISILNYAGQQILSKNLKVMQENTVTEFNLEGLSKGIYFIQLRTGSKLYIEKLVLK